MRNFLIANYFLYIGTKMIKSIWTSSLKFMSYSVQYLDILVDLEVKATAIKMIGLVV